MSPSLYTAGQSSADDVHQLRLSLLVRTFILSCACVISALTEHYHPQCSQEYLQNFRNHIKPVGLGQRRLRPLCETARSHAVRSVICSRHAPLPPCTGDCVTSWEDEAPTKRQCSSPLWERLHVVFPAIWRPLSRRALYVAIFPLSAERLFI